MHTYLPYSPYLSIHIYRYVRIYEYTYISIYRYTPAMWGESLDSIGFGAGGTRAETRTIERPMHSQRLFKSFFVLSFYLKTADMLPYKLQQKITLLGAYRNVGRLACMRTTSIYTGLDSTLKISKLHFSACFWWRPSACMNVIIHKLLGRMQTCRATYLPPYLSLSLFLCIYTSFSSVLLTC